MFKIIPMMLIAIGVYIGMQYDDEIIDLFGQNTIDQIEEAVEDSKDDILDKLKDINE
ncbi:conserved hypothetical protein [Shewanella pealeana ATCC 700345]|uniref:Uncharacterized protein n=2 Tax=Shewanella pealeana TaxID=70864 RepID=A8H658_SHEPA|nr:conserved hypothetical protein [Shewanella pealeana ATCC 700345]